MKLLIFALDGFDPDLFALWRERLPNLSAIAQEGSFCPIASTIPPMTFPAWSTFLTGVNPGRHGVFDFTERLPDQLAVRFINATRRRYPTFLRLISDQGLKVGSIGLPTTYPPEPLNGYQISGFDTPLPSKADSSYAYPPELAAKIERHLGGYYFGNFNESRIGRGWHGRVLKKLLEGVRRKRDLVQFLQAECPVDLLLLHVGETDTVGHHFWSFHDRSSPRFVAPESGDLSEAIMTVYRAADELVGELRNTCDPETTIVVSDHGMGGTSDRMVYLNRFLAQSGFLNFSQAHSWAPWMGRFKAWGMKWIPYRLQQQLFKAASGGIASRIESLQRFGGINWFGTVAYSEELNYFPAIHLNLKDREPLGIVPNKEAEQVLHDVVKALLGWREPFEGGPVVRAVYHRDEIYSGPERRFAPDLILELNQPDGYSYALGKSSDPKAKSAWRRLDPAEYLGYKGASMNGSHRQQGTLMTQPETAFLQLENDLSLVDLAPRILNLLHLLVPPWMDSRNVLTESKTAPDDVPIPAADRSYSAQQEQILGQRLVELGYLS